MPSNTIPAIPAAQLVDVVPSVLAPSGSPIQFWGLLVDDGLDANGYPLAPMGEVLVFADTADGVAYYGAVSQQVGLMDVYFTGPVNATKIPGGLLVAQYALAAVPGYLRGGSVAGLSLGQLQAIDAALTVTIDGGSPITTTVDLAAATSFSSAAALIGSALGVHGVQKGQFLASLSSSGNTMTVSAFATATANGPLQASVTANLSGTTMTVTAATDGYLEVGQVVTGTGITTGTTIASYGGGGQPGGVGSYQLSQSATSETGITVSAYAPVPLILVNDVVTGTGIPSGTYVTGQTGGTIGGAGVYTLSQSVSTESAETINQYAPGCSYNPNLKSFMIGSATVGTNSAVSFASGPAAASLALTQTMGAVQSPGAAASSPATFMDGIITQTQNWVSFITTWEPTDVDKSTGGALSFAGWNGAQNNAYRYCMWDTNVLTTESSGPAASVAEINNANVGGTVMIYTDPDITTLLGEKAAFSMGWAASLDFDRRNGRQTAAFKSYVGGLPDVTNGSVAITIAGNPQEGTFGYGVNFYGDYTSRSQGFPEYQRGTISGPFVWDDSYTNQIAINNDLQNAIMVGLSQSPSVPYSNPGYATIESWCLGPILKYVNYGAIVAGVQLSQSQVQAVNTAAGVDIDQTLTQRGWYLQVGPASAATRAVRTSPPCTLWYCDGGAIQSVTLASIVVQ